MSYSLLLGLATAQLLVATAHMVSFLCLLIQGFIKHSRDPGGSDAYFLTFSVSPYVAEVFFLGFNVGNVSELPRGTQNTDFEYNSTHWVMESLYVGSPFLAESH